MLVITKQQCVVFRRKKPFVAYGSTGTIIPKGTMCIVIDDKDYYAYHVATPEAVMGWVYKHNFETLS